MASATSSIGAPASDISDAKECRSSFGLQCPMPAVSQNSFSALRALLGSTGVPNFRCHYQVEFVPQFACDFSSVVLFRFVLTEERT